jgi:hypothetical protein
VSKLVLLGALTAAVLAPLPALAAGLPEGCGPADTQFKVKLDKKASRPPAAEPGQAQIVFLETLDGDFPSGPVSRFAIDGNWVGASKGASYFAVAVAPGTHQVCASRQSGIALERQNVGALTVHAQAGKTYYLGFKIKREAVGSPEMRTAPTGVPGSSMTAKDQDTLDSAEFTPLEADRAASLVNKLPQALSEKK